jgi:hypothetical protein
MQVGELWTFVGAETLVPDEPIVLESVETGEQLRLEAGESKTFLRPESFRVVSVGG